MLLAPAILLASSLPAWEVADPESLTRLSSLPSEYVSNLYRCYPNIPSQRPVPRCTDISREEEGS